MSTHNSLRYRLGEAQIRGAQRGTRHPALQPLAFAIAFLLLFLVIDLSMHASGGALMFAAIFLAYWLPTLISWGRRTAANSQVVVLNIFGFFAITWLIALVMAFGDRQVQS